MPQIDIVAKTSQMLDLAMELESEAAKTETSIKDQQAHHDALNTHLDQIYQVTTAITQSRADVTVEATRHMETQLQMGKDMLQYYRSVVAKSEASRASIEEIIETSRKRTDSFKFEVKDYLQLVEQKKGNVLKIAGKIKEIAEQITACEFVALPADINDIEASLACDKNAVDKVSAVIKIEESKPRVDVLSMGVQKLLQTDKNLNMLFERAYSNQTPPSITASCSDESLLEILQSLRDAKDHLDQEFTDYLTAEKLCVEVSELVKMQEYMEDIQTRLANKAHSVPLEQLCSDVNTLNEEVQMQQDLVTTIQGQCGFKIDDIELNSSSTPGRGSVQSLSNLVTEVLTQKQCHEREQGDLLSDLEERKLLHRDQYSREVAGSRLDDLKKRHSEFSDQCSNLDNVINNLKEQFEKAENNLRHAITAESNMLEGMQDIENFDYGKANEEIRKNESAIVSIKDEISEMDKQIATKYEEEFEAYRQAGLKTLEQKRNTPLPVQKRVGRRSLL